MTPSVTMRVLHRPPGDSRPAHFAHEDQLHGFWSAQIDVLPDTACGPHRHLAPAGSKGGSLGNREGEHFKPGLANEVNGLSFLSAVEVTETEDAMSFQCFSRVGPSETGPGLKYSPMKADTMVGVNGNRVCTRCPTSTQGRDGEVRPALSVTNEVVPVSITTSSSPLLLRSSMRPCRLAADQRSPDLHAVDTRGGRLESLRS